MLVFPSSIANRNRAYTQPVVQVPDVNQISAEVQGASH